ncbi:hypothetical protein [Pseudoalteromonas gelatinilytica]
MEIKDRQDSISNIRRIEELLQSGIFNQENAHHPLQKSAFIDLMICLRDLMYKTEKYAQKINFTDDILMNGYVNDVSDAIRAVRDACCHIDSFKRNFDENGNRGSYNVVFGKSISMRIGDVELTSEYEDDVAVFYGVNRLYFKRHIIRAFKEAKVLLAEHLNAHYT